MSDTSMTEAEQRIADDNARSEIAKRIAETARISAQGAICHPFLLGAVIAAALMATGAAIAQFFS